MASELISLWTILLCVAICLGYSLVMSGTSDQSSYTLTCTVNSASGLDDLVLFKRNTTELAIVSIRQKTTGCSVYNDPPSGYVGNCGQGTEDTASQTKIYTLKIVNVQEEDLTVWWCYLQNNDIPSLGYLLKLESQTSTPQRGQTTTPQTGPTSTPQTGPGESLDWCIAVSAVHAVLIVVGIVILILVVKEPFDDKILKTLGIVLIVVGACVIITAVVTAILLAVKTNVDKTEGSWIAAVVFCALGFLFGAVFCALGVIKMSKLSKKDSKPVSGNSRELRNETGTPLNK